MIKLFILFSITACGFTSDIKPDGNVLISMSPIDTMLTEIALNKLNVESKHEFVRTTSTGNHTITIYKIEDSKVDARILGRAWVGLRVCKIEIPQRTFDMGSDMFTYVVWHEVGHCFNLPHSDDGYDIMYPYAAPLSSFNLENKQKFFRRMYEASH